MTKISKLLFCLMILVMSICSIHAQNAAKHWMFGSKAAVDFNSTPPVASLLPGSNLTSDEGSASISDSNGNLLFYTDGRRVWNRNYVVMPNGSGLLGHSSSTQSALIVPCDCSRYFIFTTDAVENSFTNGLNYSVVDMTLNGGFGDVTAQKNIQLFAPSAEKIAAVSDGTGGYWVVAHEMGSARFRSYHLIGGNCTINRKAAVFSTAGMIYSGDPPHNFGYGQMKISPNGRRLAVADDSISLESHLELFRFDTATGIVSDLTDRDTLRQPNYGFYGIEFSPDSNSLYATTDSGPNLYRYNITSNTLLNRSILANLGPLANEDRIGEMQLAPDGNIYFARRNQAFISVIPSPNNPGPWADVRLPLADGSRSVYGLPAMIAGDFSCGANPGCCDQVKQTPFWTPDLSIAWKAFEIFNVKYPASDICSIDIDIRNSSNQQPPNPWNGGGLKVNGTTLSVPAWWRSPYTKIPNGTNGQTVIAAIPNFSAAAVNFNLGLDYSGTYTGKVKFIFRHCDGTTCDYLSDDWTPAPPPQLAMRTSERYLGDIRGEFLPLALAFSDGVNIKRKAAWIAVEPLDAGTEVFSVDGDRALESEDAAGRQQLIIASARKQENAALYELARPIDLERFTGGEIKLVLKRPSGNPGKPRLRFLFFDENANMIGYATNDKW